MILQQLWFQLQIERYRGEKKEKNLRNNKWNFCALFILLYFFKRKKNAKTSPGVMQNKRNKNKRQRKYSRQIQGK